MIFSEVFSSLMEADWIQDWPTCRQELADLGVTLPERELSFPLLACEAAGGEAKKAIPASFAWSALHRGIVLMDKVLDQDELEGFESYEQLAALSSGPILAAYHLLGGLENPREIHRVARILFQGFFQCAHGQYLDVMENRRAMPPEQALKAYWRMILLKSGSVYQAGLAAGAALATEKGEWAIRAMGIYGQAFGVIKQLMDDCSDILNEDGRLEITLPILLYNVIPEKSQPVPADRHALFRLLDETRIPETLAAIMTEWHQRAISALQPFPPSDAKRKLEAYVTELVLPTESIFSLGYQ